MFSSKQRTSHNEIIALYKEHYNDLFHASYRITRDTEMSEDICQDLFLDLLNKRKDQLPVKNFKAYLRRSVTNNSIRKNKTQFDFLSIDANETGPHQDSGDHDESAPWKNYSLNSILDAISQLPEGYRVITEKYLLDGLAHDQIASDLNIAASTSRSQYLRAKKQLRKVLLHEKR